MACYFRQYNDTKISIPKFIESVGGVVYYDIQVRVEKKEWLVERRYRDFAAIHEKMVEEIAIPKKLLPPKRIVGNRNPTFLEQRREQLEKYLNELLNFFRMQLPRVLAEFLDFTTYDIIYLLQDVAKLFHDNGAALLSSKKEYNFSALEVYAISERLCLPCPPESVECRGAYDFSHVLDFCTQLEVLIVTPVKDDNTFENVYNTVDVPMGRSNIIPKELSFNLNAFRNLKTLKFYGLSTENIVDIALLKPTLQTICVHNTTITHINQVLMCDSVHRDAVTDAFGPDRHAVSSSVTTDVNARAVWRQLTELNFTGNLLTQIDSSIRTVPQLRKLSLEQNRIRHIQNLSDLPHLQTLSLAVNLIADCNDWHMELGNLVTLNLSQNKLTTLRGLRKLLSLVNLDLSCNQIEQLDEVDNVACLPLLESLRLTGNPLAGSVDYRPRVLARFHERANEVCLDSERGTVKELDTALVLSALLKSKMRRANSSINNTATTTKT